MDTFEENIDHVVDEALLSIDIDDVLTVMKKKIKALTDEYPEVSGDEDDAA
jgi:hypothetical protein